jgi:hypothetical protein
VVVLPKKSGQEKKGVEVEENEKVNNDYLEEEFEDEGEEWEEWDPDEDEPC